MPQLAALLLHAEDKKGSPLTEAEVLSIRDGAVCMMMQRKHAEALWEQRGRDVDPENAWYDFQMLRRHLGRKPDLDPGERATLFASDDPAMTAAVQKAKSTLGEFVAMLRNASLPALIKIGVDHDGQRRFIWLGDVRIGDGEFDAQVFSQHISGLRQGERRRVPRDEVVDWMINDAGTIHGGFTLRVQRDHLPSTEHASFDAELGARRWA